MAVKLDVKVEAGKVDRIISSLTWVSSPTFASRSFGSANLKRKLLSFLQSIFPKAEGKNRRPDRKHRPHLVTGFRTYDTNELGGRVGFILKHGKLSEPWTRRILASLEKGSRAYVQYLGSRGSFSFVPGDFRGERHSTKLRGVADFASDKKLRIPARKAGKHMARTLEYAKELIAAAKPEYFKAAKKAFSKGETR